MKLSEAKVKPRYFVKDILLEAVGGSEPARSTDQLHASDLTAQEPLFCPRQFYLFRKLGVVPPAKKIPHGLRVTFDEGKDKQARINNEYLREYMWGNWRCLRCGTKRPWQGAPDDDTTPCSFSRHLWRYVEPELHHPSGFSGSIDGVVMFTPKKLRPLEVKIMKGEDWEDLKAPLAEHRVRTQLYLRTIAETEHPQARRIDASVGHVVYVMRGFGKKQADGRISPFKEYLVPRDDAAVEKYVRMATAIRDGVPAGVCTTAICVRAKACPVAKACFSGKHPVTHHWKAK